MTSRLHSSLTFGLSLFFLAICAPVFGWGGTAHRIINGGATLHCPAAMGLFIDQKAFFESHASDADTRKSGDPTEGIKHYIDIDNYAGFRTMTHDYDSAVAKYGLSTIEDNGIVPWAALRAFDTLIEQLSRNDWTGAYQTAADLGHYIGDANIALHATKNYDGQLTGNTGIHTRYETTMVNLFQQELAIVADPVRYVPDPLDRIFACILDVNSYADSIMTADDEAKQAAGWNGSGAAPSDYLTELWRLTGGFTKAHIQRASYLLACLWYTAWVDAGLGTTATAPRCAAPGNGATACVGRAGAFDILGRQITPIDHLSSGSGDLGNSGRSLFIERRSCGGQRLVICKYYPR